MGKIDTHSGFEIFQLTGESDSQARKPAKLSSYRQILPFDKASRNVFRVGLSDADFGYNLRESWWGVPRIGSIELPLVT